MPAPGACASRCGAAPWTQPASRCGRRGARCALSRRLAAALLLCLSAVAPRGARAKPSTLTLDAPLTLTDPEAVCNDGSNASYYFAPATDYKLATTWVVYLDGGGWCYNRTTCDARFKAAPWLMSSATWPATRPLRGLFEDDVGRSPLAGANMAFVPSCTSDAFMGDAAASDATFGWAFRGARVVSAVLAALASNHGMGSSGMTEHLLLGGCSSGGLGALVSLDYAAAWVPSNVEVRGLLDAAYSLDIAPVDAQAAMPLPEQTAAVLRLANASGRVWPACEGAYAGAAWKCLYGQFRLPFVRVPYLLVQPLWEAVQLRADEGGRPPPYAPGSRAGQYANAFGAAARAQLLRLPGPGQANSAVFAPACYASCLSLDAGYFSLAVWPPGAATESASSAMTLADTLRAWYLLENAAAQLIEACPTPGFACGVCRNTSRTRYREFQALRRAGRPPSAAHVHAPPGAAAAPGSSGAATGTGGKEHPTKADVMRWLICGVVAFLLLMFSFADSAASAADRERAAIFAEALGGGGGGGKARGGGGRASGGGGVPANAAGGASAGSRRPPASYGATGVSADAAATAPLPRGGKGGAAAAAAGREEAEDVPMQPLSGADALGASYAPRSRAQRSLGLSNAAAQPQQQPPLPPAPAPARARTPRGAGAAPTGRSWDTVGDEDDAPPPASAAHDDDDDGPPPAPGPGPPPAAGMRRTASSHALPANPGVGGLSPIGGGRLRAASSARRLAPANAREAQDENL